VDRTTRYLETARAAARREGLTVEFVQEDMRSFHRPAAFALALNLFSSFCYFAEASAVLRHLYHTLPLERPPLGHYERWPLSRAADDLAYPRKW
jgi:hypothetical protein